MRPGRPSKVRGLRTRAQAGRAVSPVGRVARLRGGCVPFQPGLAAGAGFGFGPVEEVFHGPMLAHRPDRGAAGLLKGGAQGRLDPPRLGDPVVGPGKAAFLQGSGGGGESPAGMVLRMGGPGPGGGFDLGPLGLTQGIEPGKVAGLGGFGKEEEAAEGVGGHGRPRAREALRSRSAKRIAAATAR